MGKESGPIRVAVLGLGFIGRLVARNALRSPELSLIGAADTDRALAGRPLADLVPQAPKDLRVESDLAPLLKGLKGGVLLHAGGPRFEEALPVLEAAARAGVHVVSTCAELAFPWLHYEQKAEALDQLASSRDVAILGTGVNPGFVLDRLVATAGGACGPVNRIFAERLVDVGADPREELRRRSGLGLSEQEFEAKADAGEIGHVGLAESAALATVGLGLDFDEIEEELVPVFAEEDLPGAKKGQVAGVFQRARGFLENREIVCLELTVAAGLDESRDLVRLDAEPPVELVVKGGYPEDEATAWAVINAATRVVPAEPGILTVLELPAGR
ncbi:MAG: saccharopine dehydrogenase NADP-binding domain-containing protein [Myxococcales bacterium]|jgi:hypothetical protein